MPTPSEGEGGVGSEADMYEAKSKEIDKKG
jgi:hypothetical protein